MTLYSIRRAGVKDIPVLVRHRRAMFEAMGERENLDEMSERFAEWAQDAMEGDIFFAWLAETENRELVAGGAATLVHWPPSPSDSNPVRAFVYNVWTEPGHRKQGLARQIMEAIHVWCEERGIRTISLHASEEGKPLYASMGYKLTNEMRRKI